jgi:hypothetical protein
MISRHFVRKSSTDEMGVLGFRLLFTVSDQRLPGVTGYIRLWGL